jgi:hypothetical protein
MLDSQSYFSTYIISRSLSLGFSKGPSEAHASSPSVKAPIAIITLLLSDSSTFSKADELK